MKEALQNILNWFGLRVQKANKPPKYSPLYEKYKSFTMIPASDFLTNIELCEKYRPIEGDIVECGVWKGGMIAAIAEVMGDSNRKYYLFDSFEGLPDAQAVDGKAALSWQEDIDSSNYFNNCKANIEDAHQAMALSGISNYKVVKGWFQDTLPITEINEIAILRLDGDWYDSILDCLLYLYPKVANNGVIIIDDYYIWEGTSKAVHDYLSSIKSSSKIYTLSGGVSYIIKNEKY